MSPASTAKRMCLAHHGQGPSLKDKVCKERGMMRYVEAIEFYESQTIGSAVEPLLNISDLNLV